jgi:hypothetical protein
MGRWRNFLLAMCYAVAVTLSAAGFAHAQQSAIGSTALAQNQVTREIAGAAGALAVGDSVYLNEVVKTGSDSLAKFVFLDSTNLSVGPVSRVTLDRFVYSGDPGAQKVTVNLAKGVFRFTTGGLDKKAYTINTPTAAIGVRGTILDIKVSGQTRVTLVEGQAIVCPRKQNKSFEQQLKECGRALAGERGAHCDCLDLKQTGQTALAKKGGVDYTAVPVDFASLCTGDSALCSSTGYASNDFGPTGGALCGR